MNARLLLLSTMLLVSSTVDAALPHVRDISVVDVDAGVAATRVVFEYFIRHLDQLCYNPAIGNKLYIDFMQTVMSGTPLMDAVRQYGDIFYLSRPGFPTELCGRAFMNWLQWLVWRIEASEELKQSFAKINESFTTFMHYAATVDTDGSQAYSDNIQRLLVMYCMADEKATAMSYIDLEYGYTNSAKRAARGFIHIATRVLRLQGAAYKGPQYAELVPVMQQAISEGKGIVTGIPGLTLYATCSRPLVPLATAEQPTKGITRHMVEGELVTTEHNFSQAPYSADEAGPAGIVIEEVPAVAVAAPSQSFVKRLWSFIRGQQ